MNEMGGEMNETVIYVYSWRELEGKTLKIITARETKEGQPIIVGMSFEEDGCKAYVLEMKEGKE